MNESGPGSCIMAGTGASEVWDSLGSEEDDDIFLDCDAI